MFRTMKQILLFFAVVYTFLLVSCDKDNYIEPSDSVSPKNSTSIPTFSDLAYATLTHNQ